MFVDDCLPFLVERLRKDIGFVSNSDKHDRTLAVPLIEGVITLHP